MKHNIKITTILIVMFLVTQFIGLFVVANYNSENGMDFPYGINPDEDIKETTVTKGLFSVLLIFVVAIILFFLLMTLNAKTIIRFWYFGVTILAIALTINVFFFKLNFITYSSILALITAVPLAYFKIIKRNLLIHNLTELIIYPGIAAVFISFLGSLFGSKIVLGTIIILFLISLYDIWAVWQSGFMQKMAKFQIDQLQFFTGFFVPYANKKEKNKIKFIKDKYSGKSDKFLEKQFKKARIKVNLAILGGGDVVFPIITSGVFYKLFGLIPAMIIIAFSTLALLTLFIMARKGRFYPAMPFITSGIYLGMLVGWII